MASEAIEGIFVGKGLEIVMKKIAVLTLTFLFLIPAPLPAHTQQPATNLATVIARLLEHPVPLKTPSALFERSPGKDPDDDAPIELLMEYWVLESQKYNNRKPSEKVQQRFLQALEEEPKFSTRLFEYLPDTKDCYAQVKRILDRPSDPQNQSYSEKFINKSLHDWLMTKSEFFRDDLVQAAGNVNKDRQEWEVQKFIAALTKLDWEAAKPILENYARSRTQHIPVIAKGLLYKHGVENNEATQTIKYREQLKAIAIERQALGVVRQQAISDLMETEWDGCDEWYLSLFSDETLIQPLDKEFSLHPLAVSVRRKPDKWIPVISKLIGNKNQTIHNAAVSSLAPMIGKDSNEETLRLFLPWLANPDWSVVSIKILGGYPDDNFFRTTLVQELRRVQLPEALPGLFWIIQNEKGLIRSYAVEALVKYRRPEVIPFLKSVLEKNAEDSSTYHVISALIACGGYSDDERIAALETQATKAKIEYGQILGKRYMHFAGEAKSLEEKFGSIVSDPENASDEFARRVVLHWKKLQVEKTVVANNFWTIIQRWEFPAIDAAIAEQLASGSSNLETLLLALERRKSLSVTARSVLHSMLDGGGSAAGIGAVIIGDHAKAEELLKGKDRAAQIALLACARNVSESFSFERIAELLKVKDKQLDIAVERYLEMLASPEARKLILSLHQGEALILGIKDDFNTNRRFRAYWENWETKLQEIVKKNPNSEIYARYEIANVHTRKSDGTVMIIIRGDNAEIIKSQLNEREEHRTLSSDELRELRKFFEEVNFDNLPPLNLPGLAEGAEEEFIHLNKNGGWRVFAASMGETKGRGSAKVKGAHQQISNFFNTLESSGRFEPSKETIQNKK